MGKRRPAGADIARAGRPTEAAMRTIAAVDRVAWDRPSAAGRLCVGWVAGERLVGPRGWFRAPARLAAGPRRVLPQNPRLLTCLPRVAPGRGVAREATRAASPGWVTLLGATPPGVRSQGSWSTRRSGAGRGQRSRGCPFLHDTFLLARTSNPLYRSAAHRGCLVRSDGLGAGPAGVLWGRMWCWMRSRGRGDSRGRLATVIGSRDGCTACPCGKTGNEKRC